MEIVESKNPTAPFSELLRSYGKLIAMGAEDLSNEMLKLSSMRFPTRKDEYWKYTRTRAIEKTNWQFDLQNEYSVSIPLEIDGPKLVFINGRFSEEHSGNYSELALELAFNPDQSLRVEEPFNPLSDLNNILPQPTFRLKISKNQLVEKVVSIVHIIDGNEIITQPYAEIILEQGASLKLNEFQIHHGGKTFCNAHTAYKVGKNAHLATDLIQEGNVNSFSHNLYTTEQESDSRFSQNTFTLSGNWVRNNTIVNIKGQNSEANLNGVYLPSGSEHVDNHTIIDHKVPHCNSNELYRGVMMDKSTGVFNGKVFVRQDAQKTNAFQSNGNVLLSDFATVYSKPELEIYADDVKCSHGSTTGQMDEEALFYLMSRGISEKNARILLVNAFAEDVLAKLANEDLRDYIETSIKSKLSGSGN